MMSKQYGLRKIMERAALLGLLGLLSACGAGLIDTVAPTTPGSNQLFVSNPGVNSITAYPRIASGNTAPLATVSGVNTNISVAVITVDAVNQELVAANMNGAINFYPITASGNAAPSRTITTNLTSVYGVYVDTVNNEVLVTDSSTNSIAVYSRTATGNATPLRTIAGAATGLNSPRHLAVDTTNNEIVVANLAAPSSITVYPRMGT